MPSLGKHYVYSMVVAPHDRPRHSRIPAPAVTDRRLRPRALQVLAVLGRHTDREGWCRRSQGRMAGELGWHRTSVLRAIEQLADAGYLLVERRFGDDGAQLSCRYRIVEPVLQGGAVRPVSPVLTQRGSRGDAGIGGKDRLAGDDSGRSAAGDELANGELVEGGGPKRLLDFVAEVKDRRPSRRRHAERADRRVTASRPHAVIAHR